ncbi:MAG: DUF2147 domain-containing protein [Pseudomonadales bacterium]
MLRTLIFLFTTLIAHTASAAELAGLWKNDNEPIWMEIAVAEDALATGTVTQNERNPSAVGRVILKSLVSDREVDNLWRGQVFAARLGEFRDAQVRVVDDQRLEITVKVGFMSRTVRWTREVVEVSAIE